MIKSATIWRKSIYDNGYKCTKCGRTLFIEKENRFGDTVTFGGFVYCNCGYCVARLTMVDAPEDAKGMMGNYEEFLNGQSGGKQ